MTIKTLSFAALLFAGSVTATAALTSFADRPAVAADDRQVRQSQRVTPRGTRAPLVTIADAASAVGDQPRRGERADPVPMSLATAITGGDGQRRGTR